MGTTTEKEPDIEIPEEIGYPRIPRHSKRRDSRIPRSKLRQVVQDLFGYIDDWEEAEREAADALRTTSKSISEELVLLAVLPCVVLPWNIN